MPQRGCSQLELDKTCVNVRLYLLTLNQLGVKAVQHSHRRQSQREREKKREREEERERERKERELRKRLPDTP